MIYDYVFSVVMVGDSYVGKTSILKTYCETSQQSISDTGHVDTIVVRNGQSVRLSIYDTGGKNLCSAFVNGPQC